MTKSKYPPILFNTHLVQAILDNRKKQTRRLIKLDAGQLDADEVVQNLSNYFSFKKDDEFVAGRKSKYKPGDILWVRETFIHWNGTYQYKPLAFGEELGKWKPSIHMPKEAARIFLKVTNVRAERLRDISESDAIAEGFGKVVTEKYEHPGWYINHLNKHHMFNAVDSFASMWVKLNGNGAWKENPFVWVYDFEQVEKPADFI